MSKKFRTKYTKIEPLFTEPGSGYLAEYVYEYDDCGKCNLVASGTFVNVQERINIDAETASVKHIVNRFVNGEIDSLDINPGVFMDASSMPTTMAELYQRVNDCNEIFACLSPNIKEKFNNNPVEFWQSVGTSDFDNIMSEFINLTEDVNNVEKPVENLEEGDEDE